MTEDNKESAKYESEINASRLNAVEALVEIINAKVDTLNLKINIVNSKLAAVSKLL